MTKQLLLLLSLVISCTALHAQVTFNYTGVLGIAYGLDPTGPFPVANNVIIGSPAYIAGVKPNDRLLKINDVSLSGIALDPLAEKFKIPMGVSIKILVEHEDKTQQEVVLKKAYLILAADKNYGTPIFFDENKSPLSMPGQKCIFSYYDCKDGFSYYVYSPTQAFCGDLENGSMKDGLYYFVENGKSHYYAGGFLNNNYSGKGILAYTDNKNQKERVYSGDFLNGLPNGYGEVKEADGTVVYTGFLQDGKYEGYGKGYYYDKFEDGFWRNNVYWRPWPAGVPHYNPVTEAQQYNDVLQKEIKVDDAELAAMKVKSDAYLNTPTKSQLNPQAYSGTTTSGSSAFENEAASITAARLQAGWRLYESFDVSFDRYSVGSCFTSCSTSERDIYIVVEETPSLAVSKLLVSGGHSIHDIEDYEEVSAQFDKLSSQSGIAVYGTNVKTEEILSGCSYKWTISSGDATTHKARILIFWGK